MKFGNVPPDELNGIDLSLPPEPVFNQQVLTGKTVSNASVYIGCAKWGKEEWTGKLYPLKKKDKDVIKVYTNHFNCIELNATHYKIYPEDTIKKWAAQADGKKFTFCPKLYKGITHSGTLNNKQALTNDFLRSIMALGKHLGPVFIQLSDTFSPARKTELFNYLNTLPNDVQFFLEVRHPGWFYKDSGEELFGKLKDLHIGAVITDTAGRRDCAHMHLTVPRVFIRYVGNRLHTTDYQRCDQWVERMKYWIDNGLEEIYFIMHNQDTSPELIAYLTERMNTQMNLHLITPSFINTPPKQKSLFD